MNLESARISRRSLLKWMGISSTGLALAACAAPVDAPAAEQDASAEAEPESIVSEAGTLAIWSMGFAPHQWMMEAAIGSFLEEGTREYGLEYQMQPGDYGAKWRAALAAETAPDIFVIHGTAVLELAIAGRLMPLTPAVFTVEEVKEKFMPENYLQAYYDGNIYSLGVPDPPGDAGLVVNLNHLEEAGLEHLVAFESKEQMLEYGRKLVIREGDSVLRAGLMFWGDGNNPIYWLSYILDMGGRWFDNETQQFVLQTPEAEETLQFFYDIMWTELLDDPAIGNSSSDALAQELAAMAFKWPEFVPFSSVAYPGLNLAFTVKPAFVEGKAPIFNHSDTWNLAIWSGTKNPDAAIEFLKYCATPEAQRLMLEQNPGISPLKEINFNDDFFVTGKGAYLAPVLDAITKGQFRYYGPFGNNDTLRQSIMWPLMQEMLQKQRTVQETLVEMEARLNEEMAQYQERYSNLDPVEIYWDGMPDDLMQGIPLQS